MALENDGGGLARWSRAVVIAVVATTFASVAGGLALGVSRLDADLGRPFTLSSVLWLATFFACSLVALVILRRLPTHAVGWLLLGVGAFGASGQATYEYALRALFVSDSLPGGAFASWLAAWTWVPGLGLLALVLLLFPDGAFVSRRWWPVAGLAVVASSLLTVVTAIGGWAYRGTHLVAAMSASPEESPEPLPMLWVLDVVFPLMLLSAVLAMASLVVRYVRSEGVQRRQIALPGYAAAVMAVGIVLLQTVFTDGLPAYVLGIITVPGWVAVAMGFAIVRRGLYDIDSLVSRSVSYGLITLVLVGIYAGTVLVLGSAGRALLGDGSNDLVVAASTLLVAAAFGPVRRRVQSGVDRRFDRAHYDAAQTIEAFGQRLRGELDPATLTSEVQSVAARTFQPVHIGFWTPPLVDEVGP